MRANSSSDFEKDFYKLMNNSVFGKTQENLRNRVSVEVITNREKALKRICKPNFKRSMTVHEYLVIIHTVKSTLELNKPLYVGFSVLELSKLCMYEFHYKKMVPRYKDNLKLCFSDTDSLLYEVETDNIYDDILTDSNSYDFSDYPINHKNYSVKNKKVVGKFKDELKSILLEEFIGLWPKCYSVLQSDSNEKQTAKGVKSSVKKAFLRHHHFKDVLDNLTTIRVKQNVIKSKNLILGFYHQTKAALTAFDTKRWIKDDGINTYAHGHFDTREENFIDWTDPIEVFGVTDSLDDIDFTENIDIYDDKLYSNINWDEELTIL